MPPSKLRTPVSHGGGGRQSPLTGGTLIADSANGEPTCFNDV